LLENIERQEATREVKTLREHNEGQLTGKLDLDTAIGDLGHEMNPTFSTGGKSYALD
jgi:hypothetical protein